MEQGDYRYGEFLAKGAQLMKLARDKPEVLQALRTGSREQKRSLLNGVGLDEKDVDEVIKEINEIFNNPIPGRRDEVEAIFW